MKESAPTVLQSTFHSPNSDSIKIINNYQQDSNHMIAKKAKYSQNDVGNFCINSLHKKKIYLAQPLVQISVRRSRQLVLTL